MRLACLATAAFLSFALPALTGCDGGAETVTTDRVNEEEKIVVEERQPTAGATEEHPIRGEIVTLDREKPSVTLDHEEIEGFMKAMKMEFQVESQDVLEGLEEGDEVQGQLVKRDGQWVISALQGTAE